MFLGNVPAAAELTGKASPRGSRIRFSCSASTSGLKTNSISDLMGIVIFGDIVASGISR
jgi:hypothetical protein